MLNTLRTKNKTMTNLLDYLTHDNVIDADTADMALQKSSRLKISLACYLVRYKILSAEQLLNYCTNKFKIPVFDLNHYDSSFFRTSLIKSELIYRYHVIPLSKNQNTLLLGIADPTDQSAIAAIAFHTGLHVRPILLTVDEIDRIISTYFPYNQLASQLESTLAKISFNDQEIKQEDKEENDEPIIELVDRLIQDAIIKRTSDIHIEPFKNHCRIRFRCDGILYQAASLPSQLASRMITRLKVMANLNIAERRLPQDGRIDLTNETKIYIRINCCPTLFGEKIVLRLLQTSLDLDLNQLGLSSTQEQLFLSSLNKPQGLILVTGPTGSGKTMTLYSALHYLNRIEKNISSVEDPIEIELSGINQVNIHPNIGLDWSITLRALLRQDPDILMLGEIRDKETALIAMEAAQTGHLVLSTLHTNSAAETLVRLQTMGVPKELIINSLSLIIAQRLVRKLCPQCKKTDFLPTHLMNSLSTLDANSPVIYRASHCDDCQQGYIGRIAIFELLPITETMTHKLKSHLNMNDLLLTIKQEKHSLLWESGLNKVIEGITSYTEVIRVLGTPS